MLIWSDNWDELDAVAGAGAAETGAGDEEDGFPPVGVGGEEVVGEDVPVVGRMVEGDGMHAPGKEEALGRRDFLPTLQRIVSISAESEPAEWQVETDHGPTQFVLASEDDVRTVSPNRLLVVDSHGIRYLVPDVESLDGFSRQVLERYA